MALHQRTHPQPVDGCFGCKAIGISFGMVPGGYRDTSSTSNFDRDAFLDQFGDGHGNSLFGKELVEDTRSTVRAKIKDITSAQQ